VVEKTQRSTASPLGRSAIGERLSGLIYGTIIVLAVVVAGAKAYPHNAGKVALLVSVTSVVFWLAHVYAHSLAHTVVRDEHLSLAELRRIARRESSIVGAAVPPVAALVLGAVGLVSTRVAAWAAFGVGLAVLALQGFIYARVERLGWLGMVAVVATNLGLGILLVGLKLFVTHY
jgi:hypothetical protein